MPTLIDLGHRIADGTAAYPGLPAARVRPLLTHEQSRTRYEGQAEFCLTAVELAGNTGTYLDSPWHRHPAAPDVAGIPLAAVAALPGIVVEGTAEGTGRAVGLALDREAVAAGAVLVRTGWDARWSTAAYWTDGPYLGERAVEALLAARPALVGVDFANVDDTGDPARPAHTRLLDAGIVIVENLTGLDRLPSAGFAFHCAPLAVHGAASIPVRPYAQLDGS